MRKQTESRASTRRNTASPRGDTVLIFDTTLRDGEQAAGTSLTPQEKLSIARQLDKLGVDIIEAGFPISSPGDFEAVQLIASELRRPIICGLAHCRPAAIDRAWEAVQCAAHPRIHVFLSASDIQLAHMLKKSRLEALELAREMVARAKSYTDDVEFSPMDATRAEPEFVHQLLEAVIDAGATTVNIADTVGYSTTNEFAKLMQGIFDKVPNIDRACVSVHCHDDLGLAVANSLEAVRLGARQVECTINGIGERAGNAALEEVVMALRTREDVFGLKTSVDTTQIYQTSRMVSDLTGFAVQPNKAIVGANAFRHQSGIHQDGMVKEASTYEIMDPRSVGIPASSLVLGKLSGKHAFRERLGELGFTLSDDSLSHAFRAFKELADKKREISDRDLVSLVSEELRQETQVYKLDHVDVSCGDHSLHSAAVRLIGPDGSVLADAALGTGPVDAVYKVINRIVGIPNTLVEFTINANTEGFDAIGEVLIRIESDGGLYTGRGASTDIVVASARAYMNALNRLILSRQQRGDLTPGTETTTQGIQGAA
ncbi:MAG: 2-isopropylmalate synthase [Dehalococcoidia bacterium]|nr:2-isopropylmalate synthase [Dehalococcoidia bacterium]